MSYPAPAPQPGWYPDPSGGPGQRYFDGHQWTVAAPPAPPSQVLVVGGPNNALHLALTFLTCGMWLPVWLIVTLVDNQRARAAGQPRRANPTLIAVLAVVGGLYLTGLASTNWRVFLVLVTLAGAGYVGYRTHERRVGRRTRDAAISSRADLQNQAFMTGDPAGFYGEYPPMTPTDPPQ